MNFDVSLRLLFVCIYVLFIHISYHKLGAGYGLYQQTELPGGPRFINMR